MPNSLLNLLFRSRLLATLWATAFCMIFGMCASAQEPVAAAASNPANELPTDLRTRRFGEDWPTFLGPTSDSKSTETGIKKDWGKAGEKLKIVWQMPLTQSYGTCTTSRGRLFQFDSERSDRETSIGKLLCVKSETGEKLWTFEYEYKYNDQYGYNNGPRSSPIVDGNRVFIYGVDGTLICVSVADGKEVWRVNASKKFGVVQNFFGVGSNPVVVGDLVIAMVGGSPPDTRRIDRAKGNGSGIVAFNKFTGEVVYKLSDELASYASLRVAQAGGRPWCFAFMRGGLLGFDPRNGKQDFLFPWRASILESVNASVPVAIDQKVFISETYGPGSALLDCSKIEDGLPEVAWQDKLRSREKKMQTHWNTAVYHEGHLYGSSGRHQGNAELRCIEAQTGKIKWSRKGLSRCSLMYADNHLICLSESGYILLLSADPEKLDVVAQASFREAGRSLLKPPAWAAPILSHGLLYLRGDDRLICVELIPKEKS